MGGYKNCDGQIRTSEWLDWYFTTENKEDILVDQNMAEILLEYYKIVDEMDDGICFIDTDKVVKVWNKPIEEVYGIKSEEIVGHKLDEFFPNSLNCEVLQTEKKAGDVIHKPSANSTVIISAKPVYYKGKLIGVLSHDHSCDQADEINDQLRKAKQKIKLLHEALAKYEQVSDDFFVGDDPKVKKMLAYAEEIAFSDIPVMIYGESGTGKEVLARYIHKKSGLEGKFVAINCSAIPDNLFESEFFGYEEGAFTGARKGGFKGYFEQAKDGTLFLDEIVELPLQQQSKLLRVLQEKQVRPLGSDKLIDVNPRIICATSMDLEIKVKEKEFRLDLYYRLNGVKLYLPPLRERQDLNQMIHYFLDLASYKYKNQALSISDEAMELLLQYDWRGNVRELKNVIAQMVILCHGTRIESDLVPNDVRLEERPKSHSPSSLRQMLLSGSLEDNMDKVERNIIMQALYVHGKNISKTAEALDIPRSTLYYKMKKLDINLDLL